MSAPGAEEIRAEEIRAEEIRAEEIRAGEIRAGEVRTERLDLLPLRVEHAEEMAAVLADPALHTYTGGTPATPEALRSRYRRLAEGSADPAVSWLNWVVRLRAEGCLTGTVQATVTGPLAEVAWVVGTPWQGRGIATEAARGLVDLLGRRGVRTVVAHVHPDHRASAAVAAAAGLAPTDERHDGEVRWRRELGDAGRLSGPATGSARTSDRPG